MENLNNQKVNICLSTYNAEKYLDEQLRSIQKQTFKDWNCLIRDDGSSDNTLKIINEYCENDTRFTFINPDNRVNLKGHRSFFELVKFEEADYYFFSDWDDVWLDNKMEIFLESIKFQEQSIPLLAYSAWTTVDENLQILKENNPKPATVSEQVVFNQVGGMTMMINHSLAKMWKYRDIGAHDSFLGTLAFATGKVIYIPQSTILYRRQAKSESLANYGREYGIDTFWKMISTSKIRANYILEDYSPFMSDKARNIFTNYVNLEHLNILKRAISLLSMRLKRQKIRETIALNILLLTQYKNK